MSRTSRDLRNIYHLAGTPGKPKERRCRASALERQGYGTREALLVQEVREQPDGPHNTSAYESYRRRWSCGRSAKKALDHRAWTGGPQRFSLRSPPVLVSAFERKAM